MFKGVIHANARAILSEFIAKMPGRVVNICSGNFTLETVIRMNGFPGQLESCDISLYSCALGQYYAAQWGKNDGLAIKLAETADPELQVFAPHMNDVEGCAAVVSLVLDLSEHAPRRNDFQRRMWKAAIAQADSLVAETRKRLQQKRAKVKLDRFHARDGVAVIRDCVGQGDKTLIISSPPTYERGYEKLYQWIEEQFSWNKPSYTDIGPAADFARLIVDAGTSWMLFTEDRRPEVEQIVGLPIAQTSRGANKNVYLYTNLTGIRPKLIRREVECSAEPKWPRLSEKDELTGKERITFHRVTFKEANYIRQLYSSVLVSQASAQFCYVFAVGGKVFGVAMFSLATFDPVVDGKSIGGEYLYMMCDLPIASERYSRLAKLVLACTTSHEFKAELEHRTTQAVNWIFTTAFSKNPMSMKYRGAYEFHSRKRQENGLWSINYVAKTGQRTLKALYTEWMQKHSK